MLWVWEANVLHLWVVEGERNPCVVISFAIEPARTNNYNRSLVKKCEVNQQSRVKHTTQVQTKYLRTVCRMRKTSEITILNNEKQGASTRA